MHMFQGLFVLLVNLVTPILPFFKFRYGTSFYFWDVDLQIVLPPDSQGKLHPTVVQVEGAGG